MTASADRAPAPEHFAATDRTPARERFAASDPQDVAERQRAARALMVRPLLSSDGPHSDDFRLVRRHQAELTRLFAEGLGYHLQVNPSSARLFKSGLGRDATRPLRRRSGAAFTPRAYALTCLTLAALTRAKSQLLVDELVSLVRSAAVDAGIAVDLDGASDRRALHAALVALVGLGVLRERDGDLEHWVDQRTQSLLDIRRDLLALLVSAPLGSATTADDLLDHAALPSAIGGAKTATRRQLLESPLLTIAELPDEYAEWWRRNRNREREWYATRFGLELELRAEGGAVVDPEDEFSDELFPGRDKTRQLALLILESLAQAARDGLATSNPGHPGTPTSGRPGVWRALARTTAESRALDVHTTWRDRLRRDQRDDPTGAIREALEVLTRFGLVRRAPGRVLIHPAAARYAPRVALAESRSSGERSLFDDLSEENEL